MCPLHGLEPERERALSKRGAFVASWRGRRQAAEAGADPRSGYADAPLSAPTILRGSNEPRFLLTLREPRAPHLAPQSSVAYIKYASLLFRGNLVPSRFFRKLIEAASAPPCSSPPPSCSARPSPPASTCPGTSSCPIRAPRCTSASPSPASGPSCRPGRSLRLSSSA